MILKWF